MTKENLPKTTNLEVEKIESGFLKPDNENHIGFILDDSTSMISFKIQTIKGFNTFLNDIKESMEDEDLFTMRTFVKSHYYYNQSIDNKRYTMVPLETVNPLSTVTYKPAGGTPLYDTIYDVVVELENWKKLNKSGQPIVVIQTDGDDTSSRLIDLEKLSKIIKEKEADGWIFIFIGAGINAEFYARLLNIPEDRALSYDAYKSVQVFRKVATLCKRAAQIEDGEIVFSIEDKRDLK